MTVNVSKISANLGELTCKGNYYLNKGFFFKKIIILEIVPLY